MAVLLNPGSLSAHQKVVEYLLWREAAHYRGGDGRKDSGGHNIALGRSFQAIVTHIPGYRKAFTSLLKQMNLPEPTALAGP